jgi:hypothetical protein
MNLSSPNKEFDIFAPGLLQAMIPVVGHAQIGGIDGKMHARVPGAKRPHDLGRVVGGTIVGDHQLKVLEVLRQHRLNGLRQIARIIIRRDQNTDFGRIHAAIFMSESRSVPQGAGAVKSDGMRGEERSAAPTRLAVILAPKTV